MAFGWFKKNKNKSPPEPAEEQVAEIPQDEEPAPDSERQEMASEEIPASEDHIAGPERTADADFSDELNPDDLIGNDTARAMYLSNSDSTVDLLI